MKDEERKKLTMFENVITYLLENEDIISGSNEFTYAIAQLRSAIDEIKIKERELSSNTLEKTVAADSARYDLIFSFLPVSNSLFCFAKENAEIGLKLKTRLSPSQLFRMMDNELISKSEVIQYYAVNYLSRLRKYGITKDMIQELNKNTEKYKTLLDKKITSLVTDNGAGSLSKSFRTAEKIIVEHLDNLVDEYIDANEEFYDDYISIRTMENQEETEDEELEIEAAE
jgi:hypothetical protein